MKPNFSNSCLAGAEAPKRRTLRMCGPLFRRPCDCCTEARICEGVLERMTLPLRGGGGDGIPFICTVEPFENASREMRRVRVASMKVDPATVSASIELAERQRAGQGRASAEYGEAHQPGRRSVEVDADALGLPALDDPEVRRSDPARDDGAGRHLGEGVAAGEDGLLPSDLDGGRRGFGQSQGVQQILQRVGGRNGRHREPF